MKSLKFFSAALLLAAYSCTCNSMPMPDVRAPSQEEVQRAGSYRSLMLTTLKIDGVEFHAHELVFLAQAVVQGKATKTWEYKPFECNKPIVPSYDSYNQQVEDQFQTFTDTLFGYVEEKYKISPQDLQYVMELFYKVGPSIVITHRETRELWTSVMTKLKGADRSQALVPGHSDQDILPIQLRPNAEYQTPDSWIGLTRYTAKKENENLARSPEPHRGWWLNIGGRLILLRNAPQEKQQHFYVSDHGFTKDVVSQTKNTLLKFDEQGRNEALWSFSFVNKFYNNLSQEDKDALKERFCLLKRAGESETHFQNEFLLYVLSLPEIYQPRALSLRRLDAPGFNVGTSIGIKDRPEDQWVRSLTQKEKQIVSILEDTQKKMWEDHYDDALERIKYRALQAKEYVRGMMTGNKGGGLSPFFTQIDQIFNHKDATRYKIHFVLKELAKKHGRGLSEYLFRPSYTFGAAENGGELSRIFCGI